MSEDVDTSRIHWQKDIPLEIKEGLKYREDGSMDVKVDIFNPDDKRVWSNRLAYGQPVVLKALKSRLHPDLHSSSNTEEDDDDTYEEAGLFRICMENFSSDDYYSVMFHAVSVTEQRKEDEHHKIRKEMLTKTKQKEAEKYKEMYLEPVQFSLEGLVGLASTVVKDLKYIQTREERMRVTSQSTRNKVQSLSYLSLFIVVLVTIGQTFYFRNFFKKKKIM